MWYAWDGTVRYGKLKLKGNTEMLAIFEDGDEVLICEVDSEGQPMVDDYFEEGNGRIRDDMDLTLVEAPIMITRGSLKVEPSRELSRS